MTYSPTTIAREAAEVEHEARQESDRLAHHINVRIKLGSPFHNEAELSAFIFDRINQGRRKAILTAAARMVAESGAREALERTKEFLDYCEVAEDRSNLDGDDAETVLRQINDGAEHGLKNVTAALANLAKMEGRG